MPKDTTWQPITLSEHLEALASMLPPLREKREPKPILRGLTNREKPVTIAPRVTF